jgi:DNA-binding IclR family transcriptional regulator
MGIKRTKAAKTRSAYNPIVPAVDQAARVLLCLGNGDRHKMPLIEICEQVGIHKSKGYTLLNTLARFGFVEKDPISKSYSLGPGLLSLSRHLLDHLNIPGVVAPYLERLALETQSTALFGLVSADQLFVVAKHEGNQNIGLTIRLGHRFHLTAGAHGKAFVAFLPDHEREKLLSRKKLFFWGDPAKFDLKLLKEEIVKSRLTGYSQDTGSLRPGINAVSAPVFGPSRKIIGCLILTGVFPERAMDEFGPKAAGAARQISAALGAQMEEPIWSNRNKEARRNE